MKIPCGHVRQLSVLIPDLESELGLKPATIDLTKYLPPKPAQAAPLKVLAPSPEATGETYGGLIALAEPIVKAPYNFGQWVGSGIRENAKYVPGKVAQMVGGQKLLTQEQNVEKTFARSLDNLQSSAELARARAMQPLTDLQRALEPTVAPLKQTAYLTFQSLLDELLRRVTPPPQKSKAKNDPNQPPIPGSQPDE